RQGVAVIGTGEPALRHRLLALEDESILFVEVKARPGQVGLEPFVVGNGPAQEPVLQLVPLVRALIGLMGIGRLPPEADLVHVLEPEDAQPLVQRRSEGGVNEEGRDLAVGVSIAQPLSQERDEVIAVAGALARNPNRRDRSGIRPAPEAAHGPGGPAVTHVEPGAQVSRPRPKQASWNGPSLRVGLPKVKIIGSPSVRPPSATSQITRGMAEASSKT